LLPAYATLIPRIPPMMASSVDPTSASRTRRPREAPRREVCEGSFNPRASMRLARLPQATRSTHPGRDEQKLQSALVSIAHGGDSGASRNEIQSFTLRSM
jgi:hypothetical protein